MMLKLRLDLATAPGRAALRAWLDAFEAEEGRSPARPEEVPPPPPPALELGSLEGEEPPAEPEPLEPAPQPAAPEAAEGALDPDRPWTEDLRRQAWVMANQGAKATAISEALQIRHKRIESFVSNVRQGRMRVPNTWSSGAPVPVQAGAVALREEKRPVARDPEMVAARREQMAQAEREKAVTRAAFGA